MPKTYRNLWLQLISFENLWQAYHAARRGKRARPAVAAYDLDAETRLLRLQERLAEGSYMPGPYRTFAIREWKRRIISAAQGPRRRQAMRASAAVPRFFGAKDRAAPLGW